MEGDIEALEVSSEAAACNEAISTIRQAMDELNTCLQKVKGSEEQELDGCDVSRTGYDLGYARNPTSSYSQSNGRSCGEVNPSSSGDMSVKADVSKCLGFLRKCLEQTLTQTKALASTKGHRTMSTSTMDSAIGPTVTADDLSSMVKGMLSALSVESAIGRDAEDSVHLLQEQLKKSESDRLRQKVELEELRAWRKLEKCSEDEAKTYAVRLEVELTRLRQSYLAAKADKKRLKSEKSDLLQQMKQLYGTLQTKDDETRDLLDNYELRLHEYEESLRQLDTEKESWEREKWDILIRARESSERSVALRMQLDSKDSSIRMLEEENSRLRLQNGSPRNEGYLSPNSSRITPSNLMHNGHSKVTATDSTSSPCGRISPARELLGNTPCGGDISDSMPTYFDNWRDAERPASAASPRNNSLRRSGRFAHRNSEPDLTSGHKEVRKSKRRRAFGSLSKVFSRSSRVNNSKKYDDQRDDRSQASYDRLSTNYVDDDRTSEASPHGLTDEQLHERHQILEEARGQPMARWRSSAVVAWLEVVLNMPQYAKACMDNVKSGRVLLGMSDQEVELALRMPNPLHRRKLRLAIEEHRAPECITVPKAREMDHVWVATVWMRQLGLSQHLDTVLSHLVDGRVLNSLTRREIDKMLGISRRFHQASMMYGIDLLRALHFDKQVLCDRRAMCEDADTDPLVWTNQRFIKWACSIDLAEYANNLQDSGVHGAIVVLEPSFGADAMATAMGIPASRIMIRRHLADELTALIEPAKTSLEVNSMAGDRKGRRGSKAAGSLGASFIRAGAGSEEKDVKRRRSFKDSFSYALRRSKHETDHAQGCSPMHANLAASNSNSIGNLSLAASQSMTAALTMDLETTTV